MKRTDKALILLRRLEEIYPDAHCELIYRNPWQLLVATILSAQCTDKRVNQVTVPLFQLLPGPREMAAASQEQVEELIRSTGFYRNKARNLILCAEQVLARHQGQVPADLDALVALNGVGRQGAPLEVVGAEDAVLGDDTSYQMWWGNIESRVIGIDLIDRGRRAASRTNFRRIANLHLD